MINVKLLSQRQVLRAVSLLFVLIRGVYGVPDGNQALRHDDHYDAHHHHLVVPVVGHRHQEQQQQQGEAGEDNALCTF